MSYIVRDYYCECGHEWDALLDREEDPERSCKECGQIVLPGLSAPAIATFSLMDREQKAAHLKKRSADHTAKMMKADGKV